MNQKPMSKKIAFDVNGTLDTYTFLLFIIDELRDLGHTVIVWSTDKSLAKQFVLDNFTPDENIKFMEKIMKNNITETTYYVDVAIDDDAHQAPYLSAKKVLLINKMVKDKSLVLNEILSEI